ncbi:hypothetical protein FOZ62_022139, partial [Perkinsus olseni]
YSKTPPRRRRSGSYSNTVSPYGLPQRPRYSNRSLVINPAHGGGSSGSPASRTKSSLDDTSPPRQGSLARPLLLPGVMPRDGVITPPEFDENKAADMDTVGLGLDEVLGYYARQMAKIRTDMLAVSASQAVIEATTESDV